MFEIKKEMNKNSENIFEKTFTCDFCKEKHPVIFDIKSNDKYRILDIRICQWCATELKNKLNERFV